MSDWPGQPEQATEQWPGQPEVTGMRQAGNIDLQHRPVVHNADGSISTVRSMSIGTDQGEVLIPTVAHDGSRILNEKEAIDQWRKSGQHLGIFDTPEHATAYAERLHNDQASMYGEPSPPISGPDGPVWSQAAKPLVNSTSVGSIMRAFGQGFGEAWGPERLGLSKDSMEWLAKTGIFASGSKFENPFQAFNEGVMVNAATALDAAVRTVSGVYRGAQAAGIEAGLHPDIVSIPDAFFGSPGTLGKVAVRPGLPKGEPVPTEPPKMAITLDHAADLGVIGPERPPLPERIKTMAAEGPKGEKITQEVAPEADPWRQRFEHFVGRLDATDDVKQLIRDAATENGDFLPARAGDVRLSQIEDMAQAAGVDASELSSRGLGRKFVNDQEVRLAMQSMLTVTDRVQEAARDLRANDSPEALIKFQEALLRRNHVVEQVVGMRAEWGRTGGVFQEFMRDVKDQETLNGFLKGRGGSPDELRGIADTLAGINDPTVAARLLSDAHEPSTWAKLRYYWVNALISGPVTHAKYAIANTAFGLYESGVVTPVAGAIGTLRRLATGSNEGVYLGEAATRTWGIVAGVPDALKAAVQAAKTGLQTPLPGEVAQNIIPKQNKSLPFQQRPIPGMLGAVIGAPSRGASAIHSFFNFMGYRASIEAQAYRQAAKEGLKPTDEAFWQRKQAISDQPTKEIMDAAIEEGYRLTFINELGENTRAVQQMVNKTVIGQLVMPFVHIPMNILKRSIEGTPAAFFDAETREALSGKAGAVKQDMAAARLVVGAGVGAWAVNMFLNDRITGFGPTDQKERAQWLATGHQPYSVRIGDEWISFNRFGPIGTMLGLYSNLAQAIPHIKPDNEELTKAIALTVHGTGRLIEDEVGMQGLAGLMDAINEPERKGTRFVASFAGSWLPYSSMLRQTASAMDPSMREAKTIVDGLQYYIPHAREGLNPKRDWLGAPLPNAGYGFDVPGAPGLSAIIQHRNAMADPLGLEMATLDLKPAAPQDRIKGVKLPPKMYDTYQATAGPFARTALEGMINQPGWHDLPVGVRQEIVKSTIRSTREAAAAAMQMRYPELIQQGVQDRIDRINGKKPTKLKD